MVRPYRAQYGIGVFVTLLVFILLSPFAVALSPGDAGAMHADVRIVSTVSFVPEGPSSRVEAASGTITWYPRDDTLQDVLDLSTDPDVDITQDGLCVRWPSPDERETVTIDARVHTRNAVVPVREEISFPLRDLSPELEPYLQQGEFTDTSVAIQQQAQSLAAGKVDAYEVVFALADWTTRNVEYNLDSLRAPAIQRASQVMVSRHGKCDEITALFISMAREVGIPARFVAGYSYTESELFSEPWGAHGWAEVWLPGAGWVPFDVTYGEYGYLDAGHIRMASSIDVEETSVSYEARGRDFHIEASTLDITITPTDLDAQSDPGVRITLDAPRSNVGFGSTVLILATVTNERDYYVSTRLDMAETRDTASLSETYANVLLRPHETRTLPFLVRIKEDLDPGYRYTFPFVLHGRLGVEATVSIDVSAGFPVYGEDEFAREIEAGAFGPKPLAADAFAVTCDRGRIVYVGETVMHACAVAGLHVDQMMVCEDGCEQVVVRGDSFSMMTTAAEAGTRTTAYTARVGGRESEFYITTRALEPTRLVVVLDAPVTVTPDEVFTLSANISYSGAMPLNVTAAVEAPRSSATKEMERITGPTTLLFDVPGKSLRPGMNNVSFTLEFSDEVGSKRSETSVIEVELVDVSFWNRVGFWAQDAEDWLEGLFS